MKDTDLNASEEKRQLGDNRKNVIKTSTKILLIYYIHKIRTGCTFQQQIF